MNSKPTQTPARRTRISTRDLVLTGMSAALLAVISQISLPMPTGVPITVQIFGAALVGAVLGSRLGFWAVIVYTLLGAAGLPIFAGFRGGLEVITGFTGGYLWSRPLMVIFCGIRPHTGNKLFDRLLLFFFPILGTILNEIAGGLQWAALSGDMSAWGVFAYSMVAFVPKDILLTVLAVAAASPIRRAISHIR